LSSSIKYKKEIKILKKLDHPSIVQYIDKLNECMVMEYCSKGSLYDMVIKRGKLSEAETIRITYDLVKALNHCHCMNVIHRDIKPENVVFTEDGEPKLIDFGLATNQFK